jgi:hypothetical protein
LRESPSGLSFLFKQIVASPKKSPYLKVSKLKNMNLELTREQQVALDMAIISRVMTIKKLIQGWKDIPTEHSEVLIEAYSQELETLQSIQI